MDGNGRWAENQHLMRMEGHRQGVESVRTIIQCCIQEGVPILSLFAFSSENWSRPLVEVEFLMQLFLDSLKNEVSELGRHGVSIRFVGSKERLNSALQAQMADAEHQTAANQKLIVNVVINYGGRWDIVNATKLIAQKVADKSLAIEDVDERVFAEHLNTRLIPDPDLFIRTSGEQRLSNFYLWQLAYTELYFTDIFWPEFTADEFNKALASFNLRQRRYGKITQQIQESEYV